jgi:HPt (histidine-containing phosphotransfer) domain-containing protein
VIALAPSDELPRTDPAAVLDPACLDALAEELDSRPTALMFAARFLEMLPERIENITAALEGDSCEDARVTVLSLAASAAMTGTRQLEQDAREMDGSLKAGRMEPARAALRRLQLDAMSAAAALRDLLAAQ